MRKGEEIDGERWREGGRGRLCGEREGERESVCVREKEGEGTKRNGERPCDGRVSLFLHNHLGTILKFWSFATDAAAWVKKMPCT